MATIKFLLQSKNDSAPIYLRLSLGRNKSIKRKTGFVIDSKKWSSTKGFPLAKDEAMKNLKSELKSLEGFVIDEYNNDNSNGDLINGNWLESVIAKKFNRTEIKKLDYLTDYAECLIEKLPFRVTDKGNVGVKKSTITKYQTILNKLLVFESYKKKKYLLREVDLSFKDDFIIYLSELEKLSDNTIGRYINVVKSILLDAQKNGYIITKQIKSFKGFKVAPPIVTLTFDDLELIKNAKLDENQLDVARDWLIIGCYTGQRVSDLLRMNVSMIEQYKEFKFIVLTQVKTDKIVQIPIHFEVQNILKKYGNEFPPVFSKNAGSNSALFNRYIKEVCRISNLNSIVEGNLYDADTDRYSKGNYEKWKLVSSHICRRSFATNFYSDEKYSTPLLMNITGHSTESMFLNYIGKKPMDYSYALAQIWNGEKPKLIKETNLKIVRDAVSQ